MTDPPARQVEVENLEAATTNTNEATDAVMAEANVEPTPTQEPEVSEANDATASVTEPAAGPQFDYHIEHKPQRSYYSSILYNQGRIFPHMRLDTEAIAGLPCLEKL